MSRCTKIIDVACVMDRHVVDKHGEKIKKYLDLEMELQLLWNTNVELVFGGLGSLHEKTVEFLQITEIIVHQLQKTVLLRTDKMLRRHLSL